jgi:hypothetical protein
MHKNRLPYLICFLFLVLTANGLFAQCSAHKIANTLKPKLLPYKYDTYGYNEIKFTDKPQVVELIFTAFAGEKYKIVFGTSGFDEKVGVKIYNKPAVSADRKQLLDNSSATDNTWSAEIPSAGTYYIEYEVPAKGSFKSPDGCMVILISYKG